MRIFKHSILSVLMVLAYTATSLGQYSLTVAEEPASAVAGQTTYSFYVNMQDATDRLSAVFGNNITPLEVNAPDGAFNTTYNASWSASGIGSAFLSFFPEMADDTYATIGLEGPASEGPAGSEDPSIVEDSTQPITPFFTVDGSTSMVANTLTGASYYVLNTAANGLPDANLQVKILQVTTPGTINGIINFQIFPLGVGADQEQLTVPFAGSGTFTPVAIPVFGCIDATACNYDEIADTDDGSCEYAEEYYDCNGDCINDTDNDGVCDENEIPDVYGCDVEQACNYNPEVTINDGSCEFVSCLALGCTDMDACNYDPDAEFEDGSCEYATGIYDCEGTCNNDNDSDGICDEIEQMGCDDMSACNYDETATDNDGSCEYAAAGYDCQGNCLADADGDGVCDENEVDGCNDVSACNYDSTATENDGSCDYCSCSDAGTDGYGLEVEVVAEHTEGELAGMTTYRVYVTTPNNDDFLSAIYGDLDEPLNVTSASGFYQHQYGSVLGSDMIPDVYNTFPELEYDSWVTIGLDQAPGITSNDAAPQTLESPSFSWIAQFENGGDLQIDDLIGGSWFVLNPAATDNAYSDANQRILIAQLTSSSVPSGTVNAQLFNHGDQEDVSRVALSFSGTSGTSASSCGCIDETACNYDASATDDDGSCEYLTCAGCTDMMACNYDETATIDDASCDYSCIGCMDDLACNYDANATMGDLEIECEYAVVNYDCDGNCINDADMDGVCDEDEVPGCTNPDACNYNADATDDDGSCYDAEDYYDCNGNCINDSDMDGFCDELEVLGCTDPDACNYDENATEDDGSCYDAEDYYDCAGSCINDADMDGVCDELEVLGCTDPDACNYDENATEDDGSCYDAVEYYDCDGNCINDTDGDGVCNELEVEGCTDEEANNYDEDATEDDGSCCYLEIEIEVVEPLCNGDLGTVTVTATGGEGVVTFTLGEESNTTGIFTIAATDNFVVAAEDENGCTASDDDSMDEPDAIQVDITVNGADEGVANGSGTTTVEGGTGVVTIEWFDADGNEVDPTALAAGSYFVVATDENNCSETYNAEIPLGLEDIDPMSFNMFPNPTTGTFYLQLPQSVEDVTLTIVDGVGRTVYSEQLSVIQGNTEINLSNVATGTYNVMLSGVAGTSVRRLSIMK